MLRLLMHSETDDGVVQTVDTTGDGSWLLGQSPLAWESAYFGERYVAALEQPGWATVGFLPDPAFKWTPSSDVIYAAGSPRMSSQLQQPIMRIRDVEAYSARRVLAAPGHSAPADPARWTFDFGEEISGHVRLVVPAGVPSNTTFTLLHAEVLSHPPLAPRPPSHATEKSYSYATGPGEGDAAVSYDGSAYMGNLFWALPVDVYVTGARNMAEEVVYEPKFTYHGFRYVELDISPSLPAELEAQINVSTVTGVQIRSDASVQSVVRFGNPLLERIRNNSMGSEASALLGIPNGAAGRGERAGWTGDAAAASESEMVDYDGGAFFKEYLEQVADLACDADGTLANCIPGFVWRSIFPYDRVPASVALRAPASFFLFLRPSILFLCLLVRFSVASDQIPDVTVPPPAPFRRLAPRRLPILRGRRCSHLWRTTCGGTTML